MAITSPLEITDCTLWLDAQDIPSVTYTELSAPEQAIVNTWDDGSPKTNLRLVSSWADKSTSAVTLNQTSWLRPRAVTSGINGNLSLQFRNSCFIIPGGLVTYDSCSIFIVAQCDNFNDPDPNREGATIIDTESASEHFAIYADLNANGLFSWKIGRADPKGTIVGSTAGDASGHIFEIQLLRGWGEVRVDGVSKNFGLCIYGGDVNALSLGAYAGGSNPKTTSHPYLDGYVGEVIFYNRAINETERQDVEAFLQAKWSTPALP
jgi:hypothetical protein